LFLLDPYKIVGTEQWQVIFIFWYMAKQRFGAEEFQIPPNSQGLSLASAISISHILTVLLNLLPLNLFPNKETFIFVEKWNGAKI
jgi:hypothetical protein